MKKLFADLCLSFRATSVFAPLGSWTKVLLQSPNPAACVLPSRMNVRTVPIDAVQTPSARTPNLDTCAVAKLATLTTGFVFYFYLNISRFILSVVSYDDFDVQLMHRSSRLFLLFPTFRLPFPHELPSRWKDGSV